MTAPMTPRVIRALLQADGIPNSVQPWGHFDTDCGEEVERDDEVAPAWFTDGHAIVLHRVECGCLMAENKERTDFYGGRTQMPFPTFSATEEDLT